MATLSLAKALKVKKRLIGRLSKVNTDISHNNSRLEGAKQIDVAALNELRKKLVQALIHLKVAIYHGNLDIQEKLFLLAEVKSDISFFSTLNTREGQENHSYQNTPVVYIASITKENVDNLVKALEAQVDTLQEEIDQYNYTKKIEVNQVVLDLAS